jgi:hypothetical protein
MPDMPLEMELQLIKFTHRVGQMGLAEAKAELIETYIRMLAMESYYKSAIAHSWGIDAPVISLKELE